MICGRICIMCMDVLQYAAASTDSLCDGILDVTRGREPQGIRTDIWTVFDIIFTIASAVCVGLITATALSGRTFAAVNFVFDEITSLPIIHTYLVKYFGISCIVIVFGSIVGWSYPSNFWMAFIYVGAVLAAAYFLDEIVIRRDIEYINRQISERRDMTDRDR